MPGDDALRSAESARKRHTKTPREIEDALRERASQIAALRELEKSLMLHGTAGENRDKICAWAMVELGIGPDQNFTPREALALAKVKGLFSESPRPSPAEVLEAARRKRAYSQKGLAAFVGLSSDTLGRIANEIPVSPDSYRKAAEKIGCAPEDLKPRTA